MSEQSSTAIDRLDSVRSEGNSSAVSVRVMGMDQPFFTALAVALSLAAFAFAFYVEMQEQRRVYFTQRCEAYIEQAAFDHKPIPYAICGTREK